jgi:hypothetical protein
MYEILSDKNKSSSIKTQPDKDNYPNRTVENIKKRLNTEEFASYNKTRESSEFTPPPSSSRKKNTHTNTTTTSMTTKATYHHHISEYPKLITPRIKYRILEYDTDDLDNENNPCEFKPCTDSPCWSPKSSDLLIKSNVKIENLPPTKEMSLVKDDTSFINKNFIDSEIVYSFTPKMIKKSILDFFFNFKILSKTLLLTYIG